MMHKRTLHSLLIVSFIAVFAASMSFAADVVVESKSGLLRCVSQSVNVTANIDAPVSAIEIVLNVSSLSGCGDLEDLSVTWALDEAILADRVIDMTMAPLIRFAAMSTGQDPDYLEQSGVVAVIGFTTADCCEGVAEIAGATWPSEPPFGEIVTQFVDAATSALISPVPVTAGEVGILNADPVMDEIAGPFEILHGDLFTLELSATDADMANGCENLTFFVENGPEGMEIAGTTLSWQTDGDDVCEFDGDIVIGVSDKYPCGAEDLAEPFTICVTNNPPVVDIYPLELVELAWGMTYTTTIEASDPDPGPYGPLYYIGAWPYDAAPPTIDVNSGVLVWETLYESDYTGSFTVEVIVTDGIVFCDPCAPDNSTSITFDIEVVPFQLTIEKVEGAFLGQEQVVSITMLDRTYVNKEIGGFDFLIQYDNSAMSFLFAKEGDFLTDCKWEYFTYRYGANGNCGPGACPTGVLRVVAMGETQGGNVADHPDCYTNDPLVVPGVSNELVKLHFLLSTDANLECNLAPIRWVWYDCADNGVSSRYGDFLFISDKVYDFAGLDEDLNPIFNLITYVDNSFPTLTGAPAPECDVETSKGHPWRLVHFYNGGINIICDIEIDDAGDINMNDIPYEIADAVMFTNYFVDGLSAFGSHVEGSIAASDTNNDGITLSVADLVYLIRVIVGDAQPYAKEINVTTVPGTYTHDAGRIAIPDIQVGGVALVVDGNVTPSADGLNLEYAQADGQTRILVTGWEKDSGVLNSFTGHFLNGINGQIISIDAADVAGNMIALKNVPANYGLSQNYPNPFNPVTKIEVMMPEAGDYTLAIYNVQGQLVRAFNGRTDGAEKVEIDWDASNLASGIYLYKLTAGEFTSVKKAVLLK